MNVTDKTNQQHLQQSVERIQNLVREQRFTYGQPAHWSDGVVDVSVDRVWNEEKKRGEHLITVYTGLSFGPALQDVACIVRRADTGEIVDEPMLDQRGQIWLKNLGPGQYQLSFQIMFEMIPPPDDKKQLGPALLVQFFLAAKPADQAIQWNNSVDGSWRFYLDESNWRLTFEVEPVLGGYPLLRFDFKTDDGHSLRGFVGLREAEQGKRRGSIMLGPLEPNMDWENVRSITMPPPQMLDWSDLKREDRSDLERCRDASRYADERCADALDEALRRLDESSPK